MTDQRPDRPSGVPAWGDDRDSTSELPTGRAPQVNGADDTHEFGRSAGVGHTTDPYGHRAAAADPYSGPAQPRPTYGAGGPVGREPVPAADGHGTGEKRFGAFLPALAAAVTTVAVAGIAGLMIRNDVRPGGSDVVRDLWSHATFFDQMSWAYDGKPASALIFGLVLAVLGLVVFIGTLLALAGSRRSASRGALFFAVWGLVAIAGSIAGVLTTFAVNRDLSARITQLIDLGAGFGIRYGWIPALVAVLLRIGRTKRY